MLAVLHHKRVIFLAASGRLSVEEGNSSKKVDLVGDHCFERPGRVFFTPFPPHASGVLVRCSLVLVPVLLVYDKKSGRVKILATNAA